MRIAITGGSGFLSGRLAEDLYKKGHSVLVFSRNKVPKNNLVEQRIVDWDSETSLYEICDKSDVVIHAAGINAKDSNENPTLAKEFNGLKTSKLATLASTLGVRKFIYISTAHVYTNASVGKFNEESVPQNNSPYATSHLIGERAVLKVDQLNGMWGIVVRAGNIYGAPANSNISCLNLAVNNFYYQAITQNKITIHSDSKIQRNFLSATDFCSVFNQLINLERSTEFNLFNIGAMKSHSLLEIATLIASDVGYRTGKLIEIIEINKSENLDLSLDLKTDRIRQIGVKIEDKYEAEFDRLYTYFRETLALQ